MKQTINSEHVTVNLHYKYQKQKHCPCEYEHTTVTFMGSPGRYVGKALYYKPTREQNETSAFVFEGISQNLRQFICYKGYIFYVWHSILYRITLIMSTLHLRYTLCVYYENRLSMITIVYYNVYLSQREQRRSYMPCDLL